MTGMPMRPAAFRPAASAVATSMAGLSIVDGGSDRCGAGWGGQGWIHPTVHRLYLIDQGRGACAIPDHEVELAPGRIYLIPGGRPVRLGPARDMLVHWMHVAVHAPHLERRLATLRRVPDWPAPAWAWWRTDWLALPDWRRRRDPVAELRLEGLASALIAEAVRDIRTDADPGMAAALAWMESHCLEHPRVEQAARVAKLAPAVFHRRFASVCGCTPRAWLEARRLDFARRLLADGDITVAQAAQACGYANPFHFSRVVRRRLGLPPSRLRTLPRP